MARQIPARGADAVTPEERRIGIAMDTIRVLYYNESAIRASDNVDGPPQLTRQDAGL